MNVWNFCATAVRPYHNFGVHHMVTVPVPTSTQNLIKFSFMLRYPTEPFFVTGWESNPNYLACKTNLFSKSSRRYEIHFPFLEIQDKSRPEYKLDEELGLSC